MTKQDLVLPMPVGSPGASGVVGIARVGGLCVHGDAVPPGKLGSGRRRGCSAGPLADAVRGVVELEAINWLAQEADRRGELSAVRLESDPGGAR